MKINRSEEGFTLVEIMIVVVTIGITTAIAIPNFILARNNSQKQVCITNLKKIRDSIQIWALENNMSGGDTVQMSDLVPDHIKRTPVCPKGGTYTLTIVDAEPVCSYAAEGHKL